MKVVLQRVYRAAVTVDCGTDGNGDSIGGSGNGGNGGGRVTVGSIGRGYVVLLGFGDGDTKAKVEKMVDKIQKLRIFPDENGKTNLSAAEAGGSILAVSQFTLYADCRRGNRPGFTGAAAPALAEELYDYFIECAKGKFRQIACGVFGADMKVELVNDGPFTLILED